jgi:hypothetical protein
MFQKFLQFIKYNNATVIIIVIFFVVGTGVFASETGQELIGEKTTRVEGIDNTALLEADLDNMDMNFTIEDIGEDDKYYYVTYTHLDLEKENNVWEYQVQERVRNVSKKSGVKLDKYLVEEFKEEYQSRIKYLREQKQEAEEVGLEKKVEISDYSGLAGKILSLVDNVFENYDAVKVRVLPTPINSISLRELKIARSTNSTPEDGQAGQAEGESVADNLTTVYEDYINRNDPDGDDILNVIDNCPGDYNPDQSDRDGDEIGDVCDLDPDDAEILSSPAGEPQDDKVATPTDDIIIDDKIATPTPAVVGEENKLGDSIEYPIDDTRDDGDASATDSFGVGTDESLTRDSEAPVEPIPTPAPVPDPDPTPDTTSVPTPDPAPDPDVVIVELGE